jgi:hypothetical protein
MTVRFRHILLFGSLGLAIAAAVALREQPAEEETIAEVAKPRAQARGKETASPQHRLPLELLGPREYAEPDGSAFKSESWKPPAPPPAAQRSPAQQATPPAPPAPSAPPLPFAYLGRIEEDGETRVFLSQQDRNYVAQAGDVLEGAYRLEEIKPGEVVFTYLPLNTKQSLPIGEPN